MSNKPYYPLYTGDFLKETTMLDAEKTGFLILVIMAAWNNEQQGFIQASWTDLKFICKANSEQHVKQNLSKIEAKNILRLEILSKNDDPELEIVKVFYPKMVHQHELSKVRAEAGSAGGKASGKNKGLKKNPSKAKPKQNTDNDNDIENDNDTNNENELPFVVTCFSESFLKGHWAQWKAYRKEIKRPITKLSEEAAIKDLAKICDRNESIAIEIINKSIASGWQGLFELKTKPNANNSNGELPNYVAKMVF